MTTIEAIRPLRIDFKLRTPYYHIKEITRQLRADQIYVRDRDCKKSLSVID